MVPVILAPPSICLLERVNARAEAAGLRCEVFGPILVVHGADAALECFLLGCASAVSAAEAAAVRAVFLDTEVTSLTALEVLGPALAADSLASIAARSLHGGMLDALARGVGVQAMYQPIIEIRSGTTTAFEALLRLEHGGRSVPPTEVFRAAADAGRIGDADAAARRAAIGGATGWIGGRTLFLNLLPEAITRPDDLDATDTAVDGAGLNRGQVAFEASATADGDERHLTRVLDHLRQRGFRIALDDVTDDPTVLALVDKVRPDTVKIDRSMIADLPGIQARAAVSAVVGSAHAVGARIVAKNIETSAQLDAVLFVGVDDAQGWQVGQPMRAPGGRPDSLAS